MVVWSSWLRGLWALRRGGATAKIRRSIICFKMSYFICNLFDVSGPTMSQAAFPIGQASAYILGQLEAGVRLVKALFFTVGTGLGASLFRSSSTCCAVRVSSQPSCEACHLCHELGVGGNQGLIVDCNLRDCGCELLQNKLFCGRGCGKVVEVIFKVILVDKVVDCSALWGHSSA